MTTDERLLSLERSVSFHKKTTLAVLLLCVCFLAAGLATKQEAEDITVKSITIVDNDGKAFAVIRTADDNILEIARPENRGLKGSVGILLSEDTTGLTLLGTDGMKVGSYVKKDLASSFVADEKLGENSMRVEMSARRPGKGIDFTSVVSIFDRYGDIFWSQAAK